MSARFFRVANFEEYQHYKDRSPPWIKLYNKLLDNYEFGSLPDASKAHLLAIWLLASRHENKLPFDSDWIARRINATTIVDLDTLEKAEFIEEIQPRSKTLAKRKQEAMPERETEEETERETEPSSLRSDGTRTTKRVRDLADLELDDELRTIAAEHGKDPEAELVRYRDWVAGGGNRTPIKDHKARLRNWLRNDFGKPRGTHAAPADRQLQQPGRTGRIRAAAGLLRGGVGLVGDAAHAAEPGLPGREADGPGMGRAAEPVLRIPGAAVDGRGPGDRGAAAGPAAVEVLPDRGGARGGMHQGIGPALEGKAAIAKIDPAGDTGLPAAVRTLTTNTGSAGGNGQAYGRTESTSSAGARHATAEIHGASGRGLAGVPGADLEVPDILRRA